MSSADPDDPLLPPARDIAALVVRALPGIALALLLALSLPALSATRMHAWPWAGLAAAFWAFPLLVAATRFALGRPNARLGGPLDAAFAALALAGLVATAFSPLRAAITPHLLPFLGTLALPYALLPLSRSPRFAAWSAAFLWPVLFVIGARWLLSLPSLAGPYPRNAEPFGHANITGSVCVLAVGWFAHLAASADRASARAIHSAGALLAAALVFTTLGRGAVLALAVGVVVASGVFLLRRGRPVLFGLLALLAVGTAVLSNARLREAALTGRWNTNENESNVQRIAMIQGGFALGAARPLSGWGPGAVPHTFPRVRAELPGQPDNYLQLHNTPAQLAATLGLPGLLAATLLGLALLLRLREQHAPALAGTLAAGATLLLFDHSFAVPAYAVLAALPIAALAPTGLPVRKPWSLTIPVALGLVLAALAFPIGRDLAARSAWSSALDAVDRNDPAAYTDRLTRALRLVPADPYYADQLASHLATGHPFTDLAAPDPAAAIAVLRAALTHNPELESARYNLAWLLREADPAEASKQFSAAARLAPARAGVYLGLAVSRIRLFDTEAALSALAAESLLDPEFAWSPFWSDPALTELRAPALRRAADFLDENGLAPDFAARLRNPGETHNIASAYRRIRTGQGVLFGHPAGAPPADVPLFLRPALPAELRATLPPRGFVSPALLLRCAGITAKVE